jgi:hypothetical protein
MNEVNVAVRNMADVDEVEAETFEVLARRRDEISRGTLDGSHWFIVLVAEARAVIARRRQVASRRDTVSPVPKG